MHHVAVVPDEKVEANGKADPDGCPCQRFPQGNGVVILPYIKEVNQKHRQYHNPEDYEEDIVHEEI
jgi:hypothetical protein